MLTVDPTPGDFSLSFPYLALDQRKEKQKRGINHHADHCFPRHHQCPELPSPMTLPFTNTHGRSCDSAGMAALVITSPLCGHDPISLELLPCPDFPLHHCLPSAEKDFKLMGQSGVPITLLLPLPYTTNVLPFLSPLCSSIQMGRFSPSKFYFPPHLLFPNKQQDLPTNQ